MQCSQRLFSYLNNNCISNSLRSNCLTYFICLSYELRLVISSLSFLLIEKCMLTYKTVSADHISVTVKTFDGCSMFNIRIFTLNCQNMYNRSISFRILFAFTPKKKKL